MRTAPKIKLDILEEKHLIKMSSNTTTVRLARRSKIILLAAQGKTNLEIANTLNIGRNQVGRWRARYVQEGFAGIEKDLPRGGRKQQIDSAEIVRLTTQTQPDNATHWSTRSMATATGVSEASVRRIWKAHGLKPHLEKTINNPAPRGGV